MRFSISFLPIGEDTLEAEEESEDSDEDDESESLTNFRATHHYSDSKSHLPGSWFMHDGASLLKVNVERCTQSCISI